MEERKIILFHVIDGILDVLDMSFVIAESNDDECDLNKQIIFLINENIVLNVYKRILESEVQNGWIDNIMDAIDCEVKDSLRVLSNQSHKDEITSYVSDLRKKLNSISA